MTGFFLVFVKYYFHHPHAHNFSLYMRFSIDGKHTLIDKIMLPNCTKLQKKTYRTQRAELLGLLRKKKQRIYEKRRYTRFDFVLKSVNICCLQVFCYAIGLYCAIFTELNVYLQMKQMYLPCKVHGAGKDIYYPSSTFLGSSVCS